MTERERIFDTLSNLTTEHGIAWEVNFDDYELLSINFSYTETDEDDDEEVLHNRADG